jgi:hypothetical protein
MFVNLEFQIYSKMIAIEKYHTNSDHRRSGGMQIDMMTESAFIPEMLRGEIGG